MLRIASLFRRVLFWCLQFTCRADLVQLWIEIMVSVDYRPSCLFCKVNDIEYLCGVARPFLQIFI